MAYLRLPRSPSSTAVLVAPSIDVIHKDRHKLKLMFDEDQPELQDKTPTPSRFGNLVGPDLVRNGCGDSELFQDLSETNPFDESFKKAAEAVLCDGEQLKKKTSTQLKSPSASSNSPLNTPQAPRSANVEPLSALSVGHEELAQFSVITPTPQRDFTLKTPTRVTRSASNASEKVAQVSHLPERESVVVQSPQPLLAQPVLKSEPANVIVRQQLNPSTIAAPAPSVVAISTASKSSAFLPTQTSSVIQQAIRPKFPISPSSAPDFSTISRELRPPHQSSKRRNPGNSKLRYNREVLDDKRRKFLDRNRAAAERCRERKRSWLDNLQMQVNALTEANQILQAKVLKLSEMLYEHKDCEVFKAQIEAINEILSAQNNNERITSLAAINQ